MNRGLHRGFGGGLPIQQNPTIINAVATTVDINWSTSSTIRCILQNPNGIANFKFTPLTSGPSFLVLQLDNLGNGIPCSVSFIDQGSLLYGSYLPDTIAAGNAATLTFFFDGTSYFYITGGFSDGSFTGTSFLNLGGDPGSDFILSFGNSDPTITYDSANDTIRLFANAHTSIFVDGSLNISSALVVNGGENILGGSTIDGGLIVSSGGANITGTLTSSNTLTISGGGGSITGGLTIPTGALTVSAGGASITGGLKVPTGLALIGSTTASTFNSLQTAFQVQGTSNATASASLQEFSNDALGATLQFTKSRNAALNTYTAVTSGDVLGKLDFIGTASTTTNRPSAAYIQVVVDGSANISTIPGRIEFYTGAPLAAPVLATTIDNIGRIIFGSSHSAQTLNSLIARFQNLSTTQTESTILNALYSTDALGIITQYFKSRGGGSIGSIGQLNSADVIADSQYIGVGSITTAVAANYKVIVDGTPGTTFVPGRHEWWTGTNAAVPALAMTLSSTKDLTLAVGNLVLPSQGLTTPTTPAATTLTAYARAVGNRMMLSTIEPSGQYTALQPHFGRNNLMMWDVVQGTLTPSPIGTPAATAVTGNTGAATPTLATTNFFTRKPRLNVSTSTVAGQTCGWYSTTNLQGVTLGTAGTPIDGGFHLVFRFGFSDTVASPRAFIGLSSDTTTATNVDPGAMTNCIGIAQISTDATQLYIVYGGSAAQTKIALGTNFPPNTNATDIYELVLFAPENSNNTVHYQVTRLNSTVASVSGTLTGTAGTALPANTTFLYPRMWRTNNATAAAVTLSLFGMYLETDN